MTLPADLEINRKFHICLGLSGVISSYKILRNGRRQIISFNFPGVIVSLDHSDYCYGNAEAVCPTRLKCVSVGSCDRLMVSQPENMRKMLRITSLELAKSREQVLSLGRQTALEKSAGFLLRFNSANKIVRIQLPMTRGDSANYSGTNIDTISRRFTKQRSVPVIRFPISRF